MPWIRSVSVVLVAACLWGGAGSEFTSFAIAGPANRPNEPVRSVAAALDILPPGSIPRTMADWTDAQIAVNNQRLKQHIGGVAELAVRVSKVSLNEGTILIAGSPAQRRIYWIGPNWCYLSPEHIEGAERIKEGDLVRLRGTIAACEFRNYPDAVWFQLDMKNCQIVGAANEGDVPASEPNFESKQPQSQRAAANANAAFVETAPVVSGDVTPSTYGRRRASIAGLVVQETSAGFVGSRMEILGIVAPGSGDGHARLMKSVGPDMTTSFEEALRTVRIDHPRWESGEVQVSFSDKYSPKDGGSAGAAFAVLVSSMLEGFDIDPQFAMTGDITVDGKVRRVGGVDAKVRGATRDGATIVAVPMENAEAVADAALLDGIDAILEVQVIGVATHEEAKSLARTDRTGPWAEAIALFQTLRPSIEAPGPWRPTGSDMATLEKVIELCPQHLSADLAIKSARFQLPRTLSAGATINEAFLAIRPIWPNELEQKLRGRTLDRQMLLDLKTRLRKLQAIAHPKAKDIVTAIAAYANQVEAAARRPLTPEAAMKINRTLRDLARESQAIGGDRELIEELLR